MLTILAKCRSGGGAFVSGYTKLVPLRRYHSRAAGAGSFPPVTRGAVQ